MAEGSNEYHEPYEVLSPETRDMHRAIVSLIEEFEAIDWYQQRAEACGDEQLAEILLHNKREEMEHAMMSLEWIRRKLPALDEEARTYLFTDGPIHALEEHEEHEKHKDDDEDDGQSAPKARVAASDGSLGIGSLKGHS